MKKTTKTTSTTKTQETKNGIEKLFKTGNYRVRKTINGVKYSANFSKRKDAVAYLYTLVNNTK